MLSAIRLMPLKGFLALAAISVAVLLAAAACGGGDGDGGGDQAPAADDTPAADGGDGGDGGDGDGDGDGDGEGFANLEALAGEAAEGVTASVTYSVTTETNGDTFEGEWVLVQRPPDSRIEISLTEGGVEFRTIIISVGGESYLCTSGGGEEACLAAGSAETEAGAASLSPLFDAPREIVEAAANVDIVKTSQEQIAGVDATCFTLGSGLLSLGEGEVCFSDEGLLLRMQSEIAGTSSVFEATSVDFNVTDADFEPPYDVLELPGF
ncbi:MAG: hypothetical protein V3S00_00905 [Dehalococcoidia bacterium]